MSTIKLIRSLALVPVIFSMLAACGAFDFGLFGDGDGNDSESAGERDVANKFALALGGVPESWRRVSVEDDLSDHTLGFRTEDSHLLDFNIPEGFDSYTEAEGGELIPLDVGIATGFIEIDGNLADEFETITPPQKLIQILLAEAGDQLEQEATTDEEGTVKRGSISSTGDALASVIKNRIVLINDYDSPSLFAADPGLFESDPPTSEYEAVIEAFANDVYQFSPLDPDDPRYEVYLDSEWRDQIASEADLRAYDQAVAAAAFVFSDDTEDPTGGAFGFYSPTTAQYQQLEEALLSGTTVFPSGAGTSDAQFPFFAPIQVLILSTVAPGTKDPTIPSFVFVRARDSGDTAVTSDP